VSTDFMAAMIGGAVGLVIIVCVKFYIDYLIFKNKVDFLITKSKERNNEQT